MKKTQKLILLLSTTLLLSGCGNNASTTSSSSETSGSSSISYVSSWTDEIQELLKTYCGDVLPFPSNALVGEVGIYEGMDYYGRNCLQLNDLSSSFTLKSIHWEYDLVDAGWTLQKDSNGNSYKDAYSDGGYLELTKVSGSPSVGYRLLVSFDSETGCNLITCYNELETELSKSTDFDEDEKRCIEYSLLTSLPFATWGNDYYVATNEYYAAFFDENTVLVQDELAINNEEEIVEALEDDGFIINSYYTKLSGLYVLNKELSDDEDKVFANIQVLVYYNGGNNLQATYIPTVTESETWPATFLSEVETKSGVTVVPCELETVTGYGYYKKHDTYYVTVEASESVSFDYTCALEDEGFYAERVDLSTYADWFENIQIKVSENSDETTGSAVMTLAVKATTSSNTFVDSFPSDIISSFLESQDISVVPFFLEETGTDMYRYSLTLDYDARYTYWIDYLHAWYKAMDMEMSEEDIEDLAAEAALEDLGVEIEFVDDLGDYAEELCGKFYEAGWHRETYMDNGYKFEDPNGELSVTINNEMNGISYVKVGLGSGLKHEPVFGFNQTEVWARPEGIVLLSEYLDVDMLPYEISYTTSDVNVATVDESGIVTIASNAENGSSATIKASLTSADGKVYESSTTVKVTTLTKDELVSKLADKIKGLVVDGTFIEEEDESSGVYYIAGAFLASEKSTEEAKKFVEENLIIDGFAVNEFTPTWIKSADYDTGEPYEMIAYSQGTINTIAYMVYSDTYKGVDYTWVQIIIYSF